MGRPKTISDERILTAAREVFLEKGMAATTAEVAKRARVAEGSIFKRYSTKGELFKAAMHEGIEDVEFMRTLLAAGPNDDPRRVLYKVALEAVQFMRRVLPLAMMSWSSGKDLPDLVSGPDPPPLRVIKAIGAYLEREMKAGRVRRHHAEVVARILHGSIVSYVFLEVLLRAQGKMPMPVETYLRGLITILWSGLEPAPSAKTKKDWVHGL
jgi:AcrR family transcriptional regulator